MTWSASTWLDRFATGRFSGSLGEIALSYLLWRPRLEQAERDGASLPEESSSDDSTFAEPVRLKPQFVAAFLEEHREWTKEDVDAAVDEAFARCRRLSDWMMVLIRAFGITLEFDCDEPQVAIATAAGWDALTNRFDPDAVVCFLLAHAGHADEVEQLARWGATTRVSDRDLAVVLAEGITDLHVHLGGTRNAQILWRNLLTRDYEAPRVARYALKTLERLAAFDRREHAARIAERDRIEELVATLAAPTPPLGDYWNSASREFGPIGENDRRIADAQYRERAMLSRAWRSLLESKSDGGSDIRAELMLEHWLDRYLYAKNVFLAHHRQPELSNPGLGVFRQYYQSVEPIWPEGKLAPPRLGRSRRLQIRDLSEYAAYIAQSPGLKRVELRMRPLERPRNYHEFFRAWAEVEREFGLAKKGVDIRFAIHFKRSLTTRRATSAGAADPKANAASPMHTFLRQLDRDSAMLHTYRSGDEWAEHSWRIARIDFAGSERDIPPDAASFCMNLVRGDREAIGLLEAGNCDANLHRFWLLHADRGTAHAARGRPSLGVTCHAGEDYAHPLEGTYCIASAAKLLKLRAGDTIGHGLALGHDTDSYDRVRSPRSLTVRGLQFDALLWLYCQCQTEIDGTLLSQLEQWLRQEAYDIYGAAAHRVQSLRTLEGLLLKQRSQPAPKQGNIPRDPCARFRYLEIWGEQCGPKRGERIPLDELVYRLSRVIKHAQERVLKNLAENGIALEFNPSSNLRVSRAASPRELPFMPILKAMGAKVLATINTDDPGTFGTRIENEYALVMRALRDADFSRADTLEIVRRLRDVGRNSIYWPEQPRPENKEENREEENKEEDRDEERRAGPG